MRICSFPKAVLVDLAGVLHVGDAPIPGAVAALQRLRDSGLPIRFLTNTTRTPCSTIVVRLQAMGFPIAEHEVLTAAMAARNVVKRRNLRPHYLVHPDIADEMGSSHEDPNAVVLGDAGPCFTFDSLNAAFRVLMRGMPLIAMAKNRYFMEADGLTLDMGAFVSALEFSAGVRAEVLGKPARAYFETALLDMGVLAQDAVMIGDDLRDDIGGAQDAGIAGVLVRTGKYRPGDEQDATVTPARVVDDFAAAVDLVLGAGFPAAATQRAHLRA